MHQYNKGGHKCRGKCGLIVDCESEDGYCEYAGWRCERCRDIDLERIEAHFSEDGTSDWF